MPIRIKLYKLEGVGRVSKGPEGSEMDKLEGVGRVSKGLEGSKMKIT